jgi:ribonuclease PH
LLRNDGRKNNELRPVKITRHYIKHAEGSVLIEIGDTRVICTASFEDRVPPHLLNTNTGWITAEYSMLPKSAQQRIPRDSTRGKVSGRSHEIQRLIGRSLRSVTDLTKIGQRTIWIDCDVIQADGGTRTAAITGSFIALVDAISAMLAQGKIQKNPINDFIAATSVGIIKGMPMLDLNYLEDSTAEVDMNVVMTGSGKFVEVQGTAEKVPFSKSEMDTLIELAQDGIYSLINLQKKALQIDSF